ncbi:MAG: hypothetical protein KKD86_15105 [Bacteroidetes bacterium]|nr:hypothetical protein [Bacteroidota bacterium]MBU1680151.1 hypothetical protein [Bacteroidota bacterium]
MPTIPKGQFFMDLYAMKDGESKPKYFIAMTEGEYDDDEIISMVLNTEHRLGIYRVGCNSKKQKYVLLPDNHDFSFLKNPTSIMLSEPCCYYTEEFYESRIKLYEIADENLLRRIKNCIDFGYMLPRWAKLIKDSFKFNSGTTS